MNSPSCRYSGPILCIHGGVPSSHLTQETLPGPRGEAASLQHGPNLTPSSLTLVASPSLPEAHSGVQSVNPSECIPGHLGGSTSAGCVSRWGWARDLLLMTQFGQLDSVPAGKLQA